jgi:hypothetical protein
MLTPLAITRLQMEENQSTAQGVEDATEPSSTAVAAE